MSCPQLEYPRPVRRVRVLWRDGQWSVVKEIVIPRMTLPKPSEPPRTEARQGVTGFWIEATDAEGRVLYREVMPDPTIHRVEIPGPDGTFQRLQPHSYEAVLDVLIPDLPEIEEIRIFSDREEGTGKELRKGGGAELRTTLKIRRSGGSGQEGGGHGNR